MKVWMVTEFWYEYNCENCRTYSHKVFVAATYQTARNWVSDKEKVVGKIEWDDNGMSAKAFMHEWTIEEVEVAE